MRQTLRRELLGILSVGVLFAFALQVSIRVLSELPALYQLEAQSDQNAVRRVRETLVLQAEHLQQVAITFAIWDDTVDFIAMAPDSDEWSQYIESAYDLPYTDTFVLNDFNGFIYLDPDQSLVHRLSFDLGPWEGSKPMFSQLITVGLAATIQGRGSLYGDRCH